jgi:sugar/nucleoside kinase (ribokinase family)
VKRIVVDSSRISERANAERFRENVSFREDERTVEAVDEISAGEQYIAAYIVAFLLTETLMTEIKSARSAIMARASVARSRHSPASACVSAKSTRKRLPPREVTRAR